MNVIMNINFSIFLANILLHNNVKFNVCRTVYWILLTHEFEQCESRPITTNLRFDSTRISKRLMEAIAHRILR